MRKVMSLAAFAVLMSAAGAAMAAEVEVKMLNKGAEGLMVFEPALVKIEPGDTVKFVATDKSHNAEIDQGHAAGGRDALRRQDERGRVVTFDKPGAYGVKCMPHYAHGHGGADRGRQARQSRRGEGGAADRQGKAGLCDAVRPADDAGRRQNERHSRSDRQWRGGGTPRHRAYRGRPLFADGFRPFFLLGVDPCRACRFWSGCRCSTAS